MNAPRIPAHIIIDGFLPDDLLARLTVYAMGREGQVAATGVQKSGGRAEEPDTRRSWKDPDNLGPLRDAFRQAIAASHSAWFAPLGIAPFAAERFETELVAHRDGDFYGPHIDTFTAAVREGATGDRVVTAVFYFHREPQGFAGGELAFYPFGGTEPVLEIAPTNNRLVVFPSFAMHAVRPVSVPGDGFGDARFAINCWIHRARQN